MKPEATLTRIECEAFDFPLPEPESDGTQTWDRTTMVLVHASAADHTGIGFSYADASAARVIHSLLIPAIQGRSALDIPGAWMAMLARVRNAGRPGVCSMAIAAVDIALWDLKAKLLGVPLAALLGRARPSVPAYGSGGFTSLSIPELEHQLAEWVDHGITRVKIKVGRDPARDHDRLRAARQAIGLGTELYVDANGAFRPREALHFADYLSTVGVSWFEEPVSSDDLEGLRWVRSRVPTGMDIAAGEYGYDPGYFTRMLQAQAVDVAQIDATRCLGITGFLKAAAVCDAHFVPVSAHTAPSIHAHVCCALPHARHVEYFADHARAERLAFDGALEPVNGELVPDMSRPGLGLELKGADLERRKVA